MGRDNSLLVYCFVLLLTGFSFACTCNVNSTNDEMVTGSCTCSSGMVIETTKSISFDSVDIQAINISLIAGTNIDFLSGTIQSTTKLEAQSLSGPITIYSAIALNISEITIEGSRVVVENDVDLGDSNNINLTGNTDGIDFCGLVSDKSSLQLNGTSDTKIGVYICPDLNVTVSNLIIDGSSNEKEGVKIEGEIYCIENFCDINGQSMNNTGVNLDTNKLSNAIIHGTSDSDISDSSGIYFNCGGNLLKNIELKGVGVIGVLIELGSFYTDIENFNIIGTSTNSNLIEKCGIRIFPYSVHLATFGNFESLSGSIILPAMLTVSNSFGLYLTSDSEVYFDSDSTDNQIFVNQFTLEINAYLRTNRKLIVKGDSNGNISIPFGGTIGREAIFEIGNTIIGDGLLVNGPLQWNSNVAIATVLCGDIIANGSISLPPQTFTECSVTEKNLQITATGDYLSIEVYLVDAASISPPVKIEATYINLHDNVNSFS